ncbi:MAG: tetratricopeptide repeat protein [Thermoplasmatales archaeon]|jgi:tetratricopeptide (TPR) repeat protein|nr:tetratricopeptide repeat protein [Thermoplasmatales archaeon]
MADDLGKKLAAGMKAMDEGDFKKAYSQFKKLCAENPDEPECWYYKAECGSLASGMFGAKISNDEIMDAYNDAIELDPENADYYQSYGQFCISINKYDEAESAYLEAAAADESRASALYSEFAVTYFDHAMASYGEIMEDPKAREPFVRKALKYMLMALEIDPAEAKSLL